MSKKKPKPDPTALWVAVEIAIMDWTPRNAAPHENGFHLARIIHGLMGQHDLDPRSFSPFTVARRVNAALRDHHKGKRYPGVVEVLAASWGAVGVPEGWNPVQWAVKRFRWLKRPRPAPGQYATKEQRQLATLLWHVFTYLPQDDKWAVYGSVRTLAEHTGSNKDYVAQTLTQMTANGLLEVSRQHSAYTARRYLLRCCPIDR